MKNTQMRQNDESHFFFGNGTRNLSPTIEFVGWMEALIFLKKMKKIFKYFARLLFVSQILLMIFFRYSQPHFDVFCVVSGKR